MSKDTKTIYEKRQALKRHLPFINTMREKMRSIKNSELEAKWMTMFKVISSETQPLSIEQMTKLETTINNLHNQFANKSAVRHQPILVVKTENIEQNNLVRSESNHKEKVVSENIPVCSEQTKEMSNPDQQPSDRVKTDANKLKSTLKAASDSSLVQILNELKKEELSSTTKTDHQSQIETDHQSDSTDDLEDIPLKRRKKSFIQRNCRRNRSLIYSSESLSLTDSDTEELPLAKKGSNKKVFRKLRKIARASSTSTEESRYKTSITKGSVESNEEKMVEEIKNVIEKLKNGETKNPDEILQSFKSIIGEEGFSNLKSLFTGDDKKDFSNSNSFSTISGECSSRDNLKGDKLVRQQKKTKQRKFKNEAEKLQADVMNMFIRDGVLSAQGLRESKKVTYDEDSALHVMQEIEIDAGNSNGSSQRPTSALISASSCESLTETADSDSEYHSTEKIISFDITDCSVRLERLDTSLLDSKIKININEASRSSNLERLNPNNEDFKQILLNPLPNINKSVDEKVKPKPASVIPATLEESIILEQMRKTVYNLSFTQCRGGNMFKCSCEKCQFETLKEDDFRYHIQTKHVMSKWSGSCKMCNSSVSNFGSLLDEFNHLDQVHIKRIQDPNSASEPTVTSKRKRGRQKVHPGVNGIFDSTAEKTASTKRKRGRPRVVKSDQQLQSSSKHVTKRQEHILNSEELPVRLERPPNNLDVSLTDIALDRIEEMIQQEGSCSIFHSCTMKVSSFDASNAVLNQKQDIAQPIKHSSSSSMSPNTSRNVNNGQDSMNISSVPNRLILKIRNLPGDKLSLQSSLTEIRSDEMPKTTTLDRPIQLGTKKLKPWLKEFDFKKNNQINSMLEENKLSEKFKCMGSECDFTSNNKKTAISHFAVHFEKEHYDIRNFSRCSYCPFTAKNFLELAEHIDVDHKFAKYSCRHCFYRSAVQLFIVKHQGSFHNDFSGKIIDTGSTDVPDYDESLKLAKSLREKFIPSIQCIVCKKKFYIYEYFERHMKEKHSNPPPPRNKCNKCEEETNKDNLRYHLEKCHMVRLFHCIYCRFGANNFNELHVHLMTFHHDKIPFFCERTAYVGADESSIESVTLKKIGS